MTAVNLATAEEFHAEIARLHGVNDRLRAESERLRSQPCPYVTGDTTRYCTLTPFTLTDAEREAVETCILGLVHPEDSTDAATLRGLLERMGGAP